MSDLTDQTPDQQALPKPRIGPGNRLRRDRGLRVSDLAAALFVLGLGCVSAPGPVTREEISRPGLWVDAFSPPGGDGSSARPFKTVPQPVPAGVTLHLRTGLYAGPFVLEEGTTLEGVGEVVLTGEAGQTVVTATGATLSGLSVQGGAIGLEAGPRVVVKNAHFSGQRRQAALVHGGLTLAQSQLEASVEGIDGVSVDRGATLELSRVKFTGGFRRAVLTEGGTLTLRNVSGEGPKTLVHALGAQSQLEDVRSLMGSGAALLFSGGVVKVQGAELVGHEYSLVLMGGVDAQLSEVKARDAKEGCISAILSKVSLSRSSLTNCGPGGALSLQRSQTVLSSVEISSAQELGIFIKRGTLKLSGLTISKVTPSHDGLLGDGLHIRDEAKVTSLGSIAMNDLGGSALFVSTFSDVRLEKLSVERAKSSALFVELNAQVNLETLLVRGGSGPSIVVPDEATVHVGSMSVSGGNEMPVYAECSAGAEVTLGRLESTVQQLKSRCVSLP